MSLYFIIIFLMLSHRKGNIFLLSNLYFDAQSMATRNLTQPPPKPKKKNNCIPINKSHNKKYKKRTNNNNDNERVCNF